MDCINQTASGVNFMNVVDFSRRRGIIVHLLPQVYALIKEDREGKAGGGHFDSPFGSVPNIVLWTHDMRKALVDIRKKWLFALEGQRNVRGMMFYRIDDDGKSLYIDTLIAAKDAQAAVLEALLVKFERDDLVKACEDFYVSRDVKREASEEVLESVGLQDESVYNDEGYQFIGDLAEAGKVLRVRYLR